MYTKLEERLSNLHNTFSVGLLQERKIGLEKESLRVSPEGSISQEPHPVSLGSALTNPYITTDYSEALLEFITPPMNRINDALKFLSDIQKFVYTKLSDELLWATSMPCVLAGETSIPIAQYGTSNAGQMKTVYRRGLGLRYGNTMQVIAGVHFNYSYPDAFWQVYKDHEKNRGGDTEFITQSYFALIRNLQRFGWLIPYLFGASPAVCKSFLGGKPTRLQDFDESTYYEPYATSLRMGDIGYTNKKESETGVKANYDSLDKYVDSLTKAIGTSCPEYENFGVFDKGVYQQLNTNILQIENEYYSTVRPKQVVDRYEKPTHALKRRGVQYIELRSLDVNAYDPLGINENQLRVLESIMLFCLLQDSPVISKDERSEIDANLLSVAHYGRDPDLKLSRDGSSIKLSDWASEIMSGMQGVSELMDTCNNTGKYTAALSSYNEMVKHPDMTPSAKMLQDMRDNKEGFFHFANRMSHAHQKYFYELPEDQDNLDLFGKLSISSIDSQRELEKSDNVPFGEYLDNYFKQEL